MSNTTENNDAQETVNVSETTNVLETTDVSETVNVKNENKDAETLQEEKDAETLQEEQEAEKRRVALKAEMAKTYKVNCDKLFEEVNKFVKNNKPEKDQVKNCFYIGPVDFDDGVTDNKVEVLKKIVKEVVQRGSDREAKNKKALENAQKSGKQIQLGELTVFNNVNAVLHTFDNDGLYIFVQSNKDFVLFVEEVTRFMKTNLKCELESKDYELSSEGNYGIFHIPTNLCPTKSPMNDRDQVHKLAYSYFLDCGIIKRDEPEEDLIFGDELL